MRAFREVRLAFVLHSPVLPPRRLDFLGIRLHPPPECRLLKPSALTSRQLCSDVYPEPGHEDILAVQRPHDRTLRVRGGRMASQPQCPSNQAECRAQDLDWLFDPTWPNSGDY
jgi:hypothetical protein